MKKRFLIISLIVVLLVALVFGTFVKKNQKRIAEEQIEQEQMERQEKQKAKQAKEKKEKEKQKRENQEKEDQENEPTDDTYVRVLDYIPDIDIELKYATADNFTGEIIYDFQDAYLRYGTVKKLKAAQEQFKSMGYRIKIWDAYRPYSAQQRLWEVCPNPRYVANPANGMRAHNLGGTIDMTLVTITGEIVEMPTGFDDFSLLADRDYSDVSEVAAANAKMMEGIMYSCGFTGCNSEWWDYSDTTSYAAIDFQP